eukprot:gene19498-biopygen9235
MHGYAATRVTHCVRAPDVPGRRIAIIVRVVRPGAPIASAHECVRASPAPQPAGGGDVGCAPLGREERRGAPRGEKGAPAATQPPARPAPPAAGRQGMQLTQPPLTHPFSFPQGLPPSLMPGGQMPYPYAFPFGLPPTPT